MERTDVTKKSGRKVGLTWDLLTYLLAKLLDFILEYETRDEWCSGR